MKNFAKTLSHQDRILGRIISGGSQISPNHPVGQTLVSAISNGFFEKRRVGDTRMARSVGLPFTLCAAFTEPPSN